MDGMVTRSHMYKREGTGRTRGEVIHSGHFMISSVADQDELDDDVVSHDRDSPVHHDQAIRLREGYDFSDVSKETQNTYQFGHRSTNHITIDASLSRLFECMSLAYRGGKVVSPKWKNFKGMRLTVKDKIRLNNAIWRTWHIQYIMKKKRNSISFVQFATPLDIESDCDSHSRPEAVVMEGKYWKRRIETVVAEYKKWRAFFMDKLQQSDRPGLTWVSNQSMPPTPESVSGSLDAIMKADDNMFADLADKLFRGLSQPFQFPNPREIAQHATNSDMMQPGLLQLQPPIDDFMDPLDLDIFCPRRSPVHQSNVSLFHSNNNNVNHSIAQLDFPTPMFTPQDFEIHEIRERQESSLEELVQRATSAHQENVVLSMANDVMRMQSERSLAAGMSSVQQNRNFGITDPIIGSSAMPGAMELAPVQNNALPTTMPIMISKQQQDTPTISQIVMSIPHHFDQAPQQSNMPGISNQSKRTMPPPQKVPPRRKSISRGQSNTATAPTMPNQMDFQSTTVPMCVSYIAPTTLDSIQVQANMPQTRNQLTQAVHQHQVVSQVVPTQMTMQLEQPQQVITNIHTTHSQNVRNAGQLNLINNAIQLKDGSSTIQTYVPITVQQQLSSNNYGVMNADQPPPKKQHLANQPEAAVKQPSQTLFNSPHISPKHQTLLTQLLTAGRAEVKGVPQLAQLPTNVGMNQAHEDQLKQVAAQAARFNTFQNSVVLAAARATATPPQPPAQNMPQDMTIRMNVPSSDQKSYMGSQRNRQSVEKAQTANPPSPWLPNSATSSPVTAMETSNEQLGEDFVSEMEEKSYSVGSSSTSSADQKGHHFTAEQIRRCNIKALCERLHDILPDLKASPNPKISKAILLGKSCNYIKTLQRSRSQTATEIQALKQRIDALNEDICNFQQQLPANGAPVSRHRGERMKAVYDEWVRERTSREWKFFIFSMVIRPWFLSYNETVSNASVEEFCRTSLMWLEKHCSMLSLRRSIVDSLQELGTTTSILTDPENLQQQAESAAQQTPRCCSTQSL